MKRAERCSGTLLLLLAALAASVAGFAPAAHAFPWSGNMKRTVVIKPERMYLVPPDSTVPRGGRLEPRMVREGADKLANPTPRTPESQARGKVTFESYCVPCHGPAGQGNGPVASKFPGVANLTAPLTQGRSDGYIYFYIRHGGVLMPPYGFGVKPAMAWDVVNYVRKLQGK